LLVGSPRHADSDPPRATGVYGPKSGFVFVVVWHWISVFGVMNPFWLIPGTVFMRKNSSLHGATAPRALRRVMRKRGSALDVHRNP
jgi:hypothetical protein